MQVCPDEVHEFLAGVLVFQEGPGEFRCGSHGVLLLDAPHGHTEVLGFDDDGHT